MKKLSVSLSRKELILGFCYLAVQILILPTILLFMNLLLGNPFSDAQLNFVFFALDFIIVTVIFRKFLLENGKIALKQLWKSLRYAGAGLMLYWILSYVVGIAIFMIYPNFSNINDASIQELTNDNYQLMAIGTVLLVPIVEETLYRGLVFGSIHKRSPLLAYLVSVIAFGALHVVGYIPYFEPLHLLLCFIQYVPAGVCLAWAYAKADTIWAPILMHMAINQIGILSMR